MINAHNKQISYQTTMYQTHNFYELFYERTLKIEFVQEF